MKKILLVATGGTIASAEEGSGLAPALTGEQLAAFVPGIDTMCDFDAFMKKILLVATGGTIASAEEGSGLAPALTGEQLAAFVPGIDTMCDFDVVQPMNIDSTNMRPADWVRLADVIAKSYDAYDGFVILHGTDTMAYTAAALTYLVQGIKPVALTGSQLPMGDPFTDGKLNVWQAFRFATDDRARGICVVFAGKVIAGTRARKQRTTSFDAFESVNFPLIARFRGDEVVMAPGFDEADAANDSGAEAALQPPRFFDALNDRVCAVKLTPGMNPAFIAALKDDFDAIILESGAEAALQPPRFFDALNDRVCAVKLTPGMNPAFIAALKDDFDAIILEAFGIGGLQPPRFFDALNDRVCAVKLTPGMNPAFIAALKDDFDAIILEAFGIGGVPEFDEYGEALFDWVDSGRLLVITTQVPEEGLDLGVYEVGRAYAEHPGILKGGDMTPEALLAKTMWVLGRTDDPARAAELFYAPVNYDRRF